MAGNDEDDHEHKPLSRRFHRLQRLERPVPYPAGCAAAAHRAACAHTRRPGPCGSNLANLRQDRPGAEVRIVINGPAVEALLDAAPGTPQHLDAKALAHALVCPNTLRKLGREAPAGMRVLPQGGIESLALLQQSAWCYVRC